MIKSITLITMPQGAEKQKIGGPEKGPRDYRDDIKNALGEWEPPFSPDIAYDAATFIADKVAEHGLMDRDVFLAEWVASNYQPVHAVEYSKQEGARIFLVHLTDDVSHLDIDFKNTFGIYFTQKEAEDFAHELNKNRPKSAELH